MVDFIGQRPCLPQSLGEAGVFAETETHLRNVTLRLEIDVKKECFAKITIYICAYI